MRHFLPAGALMVFSIFSCRESSSTSQLQAILGEDSLKAIGPDSPFRNLPLQAIGRMQGGCTAFHLGQGLVATAGHCLPAPTAEVADMPCNAATISWHEGVESSRCLRYLAYRFDSEADYALIEVYPAPAAQLELSETAWAQPDEAVVLGFPIDRELSASALCHVGQGDAALFTHDCDTLPGNSGSPVIDPSSGRVLGVHNGESEVANYGTLLAALEDIAGWQQQLGAADPLPAELSFGPFGDREEKLLTTLGRQADGRLNFVLEIDLEKDCDQLVVIDGRGVRRSFTGHVNQQLDLPAPVSIVLQTDYSGTSEGVRISHLTASVARQAH